jgi:hypothetical protein
MAYYGVPAASPAVVMEVHPSFGSLISSIGKGGIEFITLQAYFQSFLRNPSVGHWLARIGPSGD